MRPAASRGMGMRQFGTGEKANPASVRSMMGRLLTDVSAQWKSVAAAIVCILAISGLEFTVPQLTKWTIDSVIPGKDYRALVYIGAGVLGAAAALGLFKYWSASLMASIGQNVLYKLRNDLYRHMQGLDIAYFDRNRTGDLMSRVTNDVNILQQMISSSMMQLVTDFFIFTSIAVYMLWIDWRLTLLLLATFPFMIMTTRLFGKRMRSSFRTVQESIADVSDHLQNTLSGIRLIKSFATEQYETERFSERALRNKEANVQVVKLRAAYEPIIDFLNYLGLAIVLVFGAWLAISGSMSIGTIVAFLAYVRLLQNPVRHFSRIMNTIQQGAAAYERIVEVLGTKAEVVEAEGAKELQFVRGHIAFKHVDFGYSQDAPVLVDFNLELPAGKITAFVGSSGSGKTTIAGLITRFYDPQRGEIALDGKPLKSIKLQSLREEIGVVSQDIILFNGTVLENIRYGSPEASMEDVIAAASAANADEFIRSFPLGYDTPIGERGVKLSGGQKQRISIARAILKDPSIIILDEATASLDTESEGLIQEALAGLLSNRTCLVIAHRLSTIKGADRIVVIEDGEIEEQGTHEELMRLQCRYYQLHELQFKTVT
ncbi:ABC transporter ATP-binding protein [Paenibacillus sp. LHD-117]|uniref:ABC transporter ATP-binding protein n=1 Tax=Paenibacillus sp. LHD-117 TaxID=3071412 RepID=UPI0027E1C400|nr:ABC transporter ATP-binding protein [Paenibacillus sp. LHD-117]MDQ6421225.1 ABC transporter ATP-binding protein [Paenibacillus sp. LHD-117]